MDDEFVTAGRRGARRSSWERTRGEMRRVLQLATLAAPIAFGVAVSCRSPTQMTLVLSTDVACDKLQGTAITVAAPGDLEGRASPTTTSTFCDPATGDLGALVVVPSGADDAELGIRAVAGVDRVADLCAPPGYGQGCIVARRVLHYIPHQPLRIALPLRGSCAGIACTPDTTCVSGACVSARVDPGQCVGAGCDEGSLPPAGGAQDAGPSPDAGSPPDASPIPPAACTARVCEDFENGLASPWTYWTTNGGKAVIDTGYAHTGTHALHVSVPHLAPPDGGTLSGYAAIYESVTLQQGLSPFWIRAYFYQPSNAITNYYPYFGLTGSQYLDIELGYNNGGSGFYVYNDHSSMQELAQGVTVPRDAWFCMEWRVSLGSPGSFTVALDGGDLASLAATQQTAYGSSRLAVGLVQDGTSIPVGPTEVWVDDVAVSDAPIGCP